ncbi:MAG: hypothetical protein CMD60_03380 [Gammaproteobacteria bacterium]|nr:hypothetical protein [Gammaproteobacteria bacterium]|tara:strand:+ start:1126 stop:1473 length:348 start_codon:yes stop_codon:yes gene_type:complete
MSIFDRPTSKELLQSVIDFIEAEIKSDSHPTNKKFKFQIVLNVLNIVKREVETGEEINKKFTELGSNLTGENSFTTEKLSQKIRTKELDHEDKDLINFLYNLTVEKIKIDNPKYK